MSDNKPVNFSLTLDFRLEEEVEKIIKFLLTKKYISYEYEEVMLQKYNVYRVTINSVFTSNIFKIAKEIRNFDEDEEDFLELLELPVKIIKHEAGYLEVISAPCKECDDDGCNEGKLCRYSYKLNKGE